MILFLDLETTGLDERTGSILEVAAILTNDGLETVSQFQTNVRPILGLAAMADFVREMHTDNGLLAEIEAGNCCRRFEAEVKLINWLGRFPAAANVVLAGNTVHFDKYWLREHMPTFHNMLHYRIIDVTSFNEMAQRLNKTLHAGRPGAGGEPAHRALDDAQQSLDTMKYYVANGLFKETLMTPNEYQQLALRTEKTPDFVNPVFIEERKARGVDGGLDAKQLGRLIHAELGCCTETGESQDMVKKALIYGKPFDTVNVLEEVGDQMWYIALALDACGFTLEEAMTRNIAKLQKRFPERFTEERALTRNLEAERAALEGNE